MPFSSIDIIKVATSPQNQNYKTYLTWLKQGFLPLPSCPGKKMYTNGFRSRTALYWSDSEVRPGTEAELDAAWEAIRCERNAKARQYYSKRKEKAKAYQAALRRQEEQARKINDRYRLLEEAAALPAIPCHNPSKIVVFDLETTGLDPCKDEILQIAILDGDGNPLLDTYVKPYIHTGWCDAERIHGISPDMVAGAPHLHTLIPVIKGIFESAELIVSYNGSSFDANFLETAFVNIGDIPQFDVMHEFAPIYGDWDERNECYRWQSLSTCANHYGYTYNPHDALEDCKATLHCYKSIVQEKQRQKCIEFTDISTTLKKVMLKKNTLSVTGVDHFIFPRVGFVPADQLFSLSGLAACGLWKCPDMQLDETTRLADIIINKETAPALFTDDPYAHPIKRLGLRAVVAMPIETNPRSLRFRFVLNYQKIATGADTCMYFDMMTTLDSLYEEIRDRLFYLDADTGQYVPKKFKNVLIYGEWNGQGCLWCNNRNFRKECPGDPLCPKVIYESLFILPNFIYTE